MAYFLEYLVPAEHDGAEVPVDAPTPDGGTAERVIHLDALPARSQISADSLGDARAEAEQLLAHSKAESGELSRTRTIRWRPGAAGEPAPSARVRGGPRTDPYQVSFV